MCQSSCMMTKHEIPRSVLKFIEERTLIKLTAHTIEVEGRQIYCFLFSFSHSTFLSQFQTAVVKVPFIDGEQLLDVVNGILEADEKAVNGELMTNAERRRNLKGQSHTFVPERDPNYVPPPVNKGRASPKSAGKKRSTKKGTSKRSRSSVR